MNWSAQQYVILVVVAGCTALVLRLFQLHRGDANPAMRWITASLGILTFSLVLQFKVVHTAVDAVTVLNMAGTLSNCATLLAAACAQRGFLHVVRPGARANTLLRWTFGVIVLVVVLFLLVPSNYEEVLANAGEPIQVPVTSAAGYLYLVSLTVLCVGLIRTSWAYVLVAERFSLRYGLVAISVAAVIAIAYTVVRLAAMVTYQLGVVVPAIRGNLIGDLYLTAAGLVFLGIALPLVGGRLGLDHLAHWWRVDRSYRRLDPLWRALHDEFPGLALDAPTRHAGFRHPEHALYRRIIEIWDGRLRLRPHLDPAAVPGGSAAEAALIADGLRRRREGVPVTDGRAAADNRPDDPDAELGWLIEVSRALPR
ncbi:MAB_1171c family putative transporter [Lentzea sp. NPDC058450]|uniref:MAB_1171c family putative transporter n=1 Tax=Lentzea sp. NPDC058450 TaxID=3346505 RepID=UPI003651A84B